MLLVERLVPLCAGLVSAHVETDVDRADDRRGIAADLGAPRVEHVALACPVRGRQVRCVPAVGEPGCRAQRPFLAGASDPERESCLERLRIVRGVHEAVVRAVEVGATSIEQETQRLRVFLELILALGDGRERDAVRRELDLVPSRADAAIGPPARKMVDGADRFCQDAGMPVPDAEDKAADTDATRLHRRGGECGDRFETIAVASLRRRLLTVVGHREPIKPALVGEAPEPTHLIEWTTEVAEMYPELNTQDPSMGRLTVLPSGIPSSGSLARSSQALGRPSPEPPR